MLDLDGIGYVQDERVLEGTAVRFRIAGGGGLTSDGRWAVEPAGEAVFRTRLLVYRPADAARASGTVVVHWNNVTMGHDLIDDVSEVFRAGHTFVAVTAQRLGVEHLRRWDPARYGSLRLESDDFSYDVFTQAARAVRRLDGVVADRVLAMGASQSAGRLATYVNAIQPVARVFDGFLLQLYFGTATPLEVGDAVVDTSAPGYEERRRALMIGRHRFRDDGTTPVLVVNSELEARAMAHVDQQDTPTVRIWEAAGTAHTSRPAELARAPRLERDGLTAAGPRPGMNEVSLLPLYDEALRALAEWVRTGSPPRPQPRIEFRGDPPEVVRDATGVARGGIRLPEVEAGGAVHTSEPCEDGFVGWLSGSTRRVQGQPGDSSQPMRAR